MVVKINISNKVAYTIIAVIAILILGIVVYAYGTSNPSAFGHSGDEINVTVSGQSKTLNQALSDLSSGASRGCTMIAESPLAVSTLSVTVPASCKNSDGCYIVLLVYNSAGALTIRTMTYSQYDIDTKGYWGGTEATVNGDTTSDIILAFGVYLYDDKTGTETDKDHWTLFDNTASYSSKVYVCS